VNMGPIIVISADKLSQSMFCSYLSQISLIGKEVVVRDINLLYSPDVQEQMIDEFLTQLDKSQLLVVKYKIKINTDMDKFKLPPKIQDAASYIVLFDMYSTHPEVLKDTQQFPKILDRWEDYIKGLS